MDEFRRNSQAGMGKKLTSKQRVDFAEMLRPHHRYPAGVYGLRSVFVLAGIVAFLIVLILAFAGKDKRTGPGERMPC